MKFWVNLILFCVLTWGCQDNPCEGMECGPGSCVDGHCECPIAYSGEKCEIERRQALLGDFRAVEVSQSGSVSYDCRIYEDPINTGAVLIENIHNEGFTVVANAASDGFSIPEQIKGLGIFSGSLFPNSVDTIVNLEYRIRYDLSPEKYCVATLYRK